MNKITHLGAYGIVVNNDKILLIKKMGGPYNNKLDLPGGTIEFKEKPCEALIRELKEETGIDVISYNLFDVDSIYLEWKHNGEMEALNHIGIFYKIEKYQNDIKTNISIDCQNDDSLGAQFYEIKKLTNRIYLILQY